MAQHNEIGRLGEQLACEKLVREGYAIIERNWRMRHYEIDIIASKGPRIIFIEVKTRSSDFTDPIDAVDIRKIRRMCASANVYMQNARTHLEPQFDIIGVTILPEKTEIEHIEDAFIPPLKTYR